MLSAISLKIYELRKWLLLSLIISTMAIPIAEGLVLHRDRNRNEMYGEAFWIYGFEVYQMTDEELIDRLEQLPDGWDFQNRSDYVLPSFINVSYEYPVFGLIFFAIATWLYPGVQGAQGLWLNFILVLVFNLNLVLIAILLGDKPKKYPWARMFVAGYFIYGLFMSAAGGKLEPIVDCLFLMALVLRKEQQMGKSMVALSLSVQTKIYSAMAFPLFFVEAPAASIWFFVTLMLTVVPFMLGADFNSLLSHFLNLSSYSSYIVNGLYPGLFFTTPASGTGESYIWPPALIPLVIYIAFILYTISLYIPNKEEFLRVSWRERIYLLKPFYIYMIPAVLFVFRWVMPWYLFWFAPMVLLFEDNEQASGYMKHVTVVGFLYTFGVFCNYPYFIAGPLPDFLNEFVFGYQTMVALVLIIALTFILIVVWRWDSERRGERERVLREARERGELII